MPPSRRARKPGTAFFSAYEDVHGTELWRSDGSRRGTRLARDIRSGKKDSNPGRLINVAGMLFFPANDGAHGRELWKVVP